MTIIFLLLSWITGLVLLMKIVTLIVFAVLADKEKTILARRGVSTTGKILVHKYIYKKLNFIMLFTGDIKYADTVDHTVSVEFELDGEKVFKETVNYPKLRDCTVGQTVDIVFDRENPDCFSINGGRRMSARIIPEIIKAGELLLLQIILAFMSIIF